MLPTSPKPARHKRRRLGLRIHSMHLRNRDFFVMLPIQENRGGSMYRRFAFALVVVVVASVAGWAQDVQTGKWTLNVAKSQFKTSPAPKTQIVTITSEGKDGVKVAADVTRTNGAKAAFSYAGQYDGKENPRVETGDGAVQGQTVTLKKLDNRTVERI